MNRQLELVFLRPTFNDYLAASQRWEARYEHLTPEGKQESLKAWEIMSAYKNHASGF